MEARKFRIASAPLTSAAQILIARMAGAQNNVRVPMRTKPQATNGGIKL
jgi:hypothetical protein